MAVQPPVGEPGEPSNRLPWIALALGLVVIGVAAAVFLFNRQRTINITAESTPTVAVAARAGAASPAPPTPVSPAVLPSATLAPTATPTAVPVPTKPVAPTQPPAPPPTQPAAPPPTQLPAVQAVPPPPPQPTEPSAPTLPAQPGAQPTQAPPPTLPTAQPTPPPSAAAPLSPTPFVGQVANPGGAGNTRADFDAAYGPPVGETADHLVVYRKNNLEYHVSFVPDPDGRAAVLVEMPQPQTNASPSTMESAMAEAHKLLPKDAQPPNPQPEGSDQFVVERYTSQLLGQALPASAFTANKGQPGQFLLVYVRDPAQQSRSTRFIVGPGTDPQALINQGR